MDKLVNYKNISSGNASDEDVPAVPENNFALKQGDINNYVLTANSNKAIAIPSGAKYALFNANADIWVNIGSTATIPTVDLTTGVGSELNPDLRYLATLATINIISQYAAKVSIMFYT